MQLTKFLEEEKEKRKKLRKQLPTLDGIYSAGEIKEELLKSYTPMELEEITFEIQSYLQEKEENNE